MQRLSVMIFALCLFSLAKAQTSGFKWLNEIDYSQVRNYSEGLAAFESDGKWGFLDANQKVIIPAIYEETRDFKEGAAIVKNEGKWGAVNRSGEWICTAIFDEMGDFNSGMSLAKFGNKYCYLKQNGKKVILQSGYKYFNYHNGMARLSKNDKWGYLNLKGECVIPLQYTSASDFSADHALVSKGNKNYYITKLGKRTSIEEEFVPVSLSDDMLLLKKDEMYSYQNLYSGKMSNWYKEATPFKNGYAHVTLSNDHKAYVNKDGMQIGDFQFGYDLGDFHDGLASVRLDKLSGYVNAYGEVSVQPIFNSTTDFDNGLAIVNYKGRNGVIRLANKEETQPSVKITGIRLNDANHNSAIDPGEHFTVAVAIKNASLETLRNAKVALTKNMSNMKWLTMNDSLVYVKELGVGRDTVVCFNGRAQRDTESQDALFSVSFSASNVMDVESSQAEFNVRGIHNCRPQVSGYWAYKEDHTPLKNGDRVNLRINLMNSGTDMASDVKIVLQWPQQLSGENEPIIIPSIAPGATASVNTSFKIDSLATEPELTIIANLTEYTGTHNDIKYLQVETGKLNRQIALISTPEMIPDATLLAKANTAMEDEATSSELFKGLAQMCKPDKNKYALVIGNEKYIENRRSITSEMNVDYAEKDAQAFAKYAEKVLGVPTNQIVELENATLAQMKGNINRLCKLSSINPNNVELILYYAGHGQHDPDSKDTYLMPVDVSLQTPRDGVKLEEVYAQLSGCQSKRVTVFLDACYSGVGRGIVIKPKNPSIKGDMVIFTGSSSVQRSMPYKEKKHGMFTYFLLKALKESNGDLTVSQLFDQVRRSVQQNSIWINNTEQTPELLKGNDIDQGWENWKMY